MEIKQVLIDPEAARSRFATMAVAIAFELGAEQMELHAIRRCAEAASRNEAAPVPAELWHRIEPVVSAWNRIWCECVESGLDESDAVHREIPAICQDKEVVNAFRKVQPLIQPLRD